MDGQVNLRPVSFGPQLPNALTEPDTDIGCLASQHGWILSAQLRVPEIRCDQEIAIRGRRAAVRTFANKRYDGALTNLHG